MEAMIVAAITAVVAFILIYFVVDCQALGKDPSVNPLQVRMAVLWMHVLLFVSSHMDSFLLAISWGLLVGHIVTIQFNFKLLHLTV